MAPMTRLMSESGGHASEAGTARRCLSCTNNASPVRFFRCSCSKKCERQRKNCDCSWGAQSLPKEKATRTTTRTGIKSLIYIHLPTNKHRDSVNNESQDPCWSNSPARAVHQSDHHPQYPPTYRSYINSEITELEMEERTSTGVSSARNLFPACMNLNVPVKTPMRVIMENVF